MIHKRTVFCCVMAALVVLQISMAAASASGLAVTRKERLGGTLAVTNGSLSVNGRVVSWDDVVVVINDKVTGGKAGENALELNSGEVWAGRIESMQGGAVVFDSPVLGKKNVPLADIRSLNFQPGLPAAIQPETNVLHRMRGKPSRGALISIDAKKISAETVLGTIAFERDKIERYVLNIGEAAVSEPAGAHDSVAMVDGSVLFGTIRLQGDSLILSHSVAGEKKLADDSWVWVRRHSPALVHLADKPPASTQTFPLIRRAPDAPRVECGPPPRADESQLFVRRIRMLPKTIVTYKPGAGEFRSTLSLDPRSRGPAVVRFSVGEKVVKEQVLNPTNNIPVAVSFPVDADVPLGVEVNFDKAILFPCTVAMDDPFVMLKK